MILTIDDSHLVNYTELCVTDAKWRVEENNPNSTRVVAVDAQDNFICLVCEAFGNGIAEDIATAHNETLKYDQLLKRYKTLQRELEIIKRDLSCRVGLV